MGSGAAVVESAVQELVKAGQRVGLVKVHLFRPWSAEHLLAVLPQSVKRIAVLDRTKEHGSGGAQRAQRRVALEMLKHKLGRGSDVRLQVCCGEGAETDPALHCRLPSTLACRRAAAAGRGLHPAAGPAQGGRGGGGPLRPGLQGTVCAWLCQL